MADPVEELLSWGAQRGRLSQRASCIDAMGGGPASSSSATPPSKLVTALLEAWAAKAMPACMVQEFALAAVNDGLLHSEVVKLASIGNHGRNPSRCAQDIIKVFGFESALAKIPPCARVQIPMVDQKANKVVYQDTEIQFPHDVFSYLSDHDPEKFKQVFGTNSDVRDFWRNQDRADPKLYKHPLLTIPRYEERVLVGKLHSDGVVMTKKDTLHVISLMSFFAQGDLLDSVLYFASVVKRCCCKESTHGADTLDVLYRILAWSLSACLYNRHPVLDWNLQPWNRPGDEDRARLANTKLNNDDMSFAIIGLCSDLDELCNTYQLAHFNSNTPCFWCPADMDVCPWSDFSSTSPCFSQAYSPPSDGSDVPKPNGHAVWTIPGLTIHSILWDILHGLDLGPSQHVIGNCFFDFCQNSLLGTNRAERLAWVWDRLRHFYSAARPPSKLDNLTLRMTMDDPDRPYSAFPKLKAKANESRHILPFLLNILDDPLIARHPDADPEYIHNRRATVLYLCRFYGLIDTPDMFLSGAAVTEAQECVDCFLLHYNWMTSYAIAHRRMQWQITIKFHYFKHAGVSLRWLNPKHGSTYPFESYVGAIAKIGRSASYGKPAHTIGRFLLQKLRTIAAVARRREIAA